MVSEPKDFRKWHLLNQITLESKLSFEDCFYELLDNLYEGVYIIDHQRRILYWNKSAEQITGYKSEEVLGKTCYDDILKHTDKMGNNLCSSSCPMVKVINEGIYVEDEVYLHHKVGYRLTVKIKGIPIKYGKKVIGGIELFNPILKTNGVDSKEEDDMVSLALKDPLTKVFNRRGLELIYPLRQREMMLLNYYVGCLLFDIDNFKKINDTYGHDCGDKVLFTIAKTFVNILRERDIVVRWGGEEFVLIVFVKDAQIVNSIGNRIVKIVESLFIEHKNEIIKGDCSKYSTSIIIYSGGGNYELSRTRRNSIL